MKIKRGYGYIAVRILNHLLLYFLAFVFFLPFLWMVSTSLKTDEQLFIIPPQWIPKPMVFDHYRQAVTLIPYILYLRNTLIICLVNVIGVLFSSILVAYGFSKIPWKGRNIFFMIMLSTMMLPYQVTMIPIFIIFRKINWVGTFRPLTIPSFFGNAFYIFLLRQFFMTIPLELSDAAKIDGAGDMSILLNIILPLAKPALTTIALFTFISNWNDFLGPLIYLNDASKYTISLGLQQFQSAYDTQWQNLMAATTISILPIMIMFFLAQRTFVEGITLTGIKG